MILLVMNLYLFPASGLAFAQEWLPNPYFQFMNVDENRNTCFDQELKSQWPAMANEKTFWTSPVAGENGDHFDSVKIRFCTQSSTRAGYCGTMYEVTLVTSQPKGWSVDDSHASEYKYYVTAKDVGRFADVSLTKTGEKVSVLDMAACKSFLGIP